MFQYTEYIFLLFSTKINLFLSKVLFPQQTRRNRQPGHKSKSVDTFFVEIYALNNILQFPNNYIFYAQNHLKKHYNHYNKSYIFRYIEFLLNLILLEKKHNQSLQLENFRFHIFVSLDIMANHSLYLSYDKRLNNGLSIVWQSFEKSIQYKFSNLFYL